MTAANRQRPSREAAKSCSRVASAPGDAMTNHSQPRSGDMHRPVREMPPPLGLEKGNPRWRAHVYLGLTPPGYAISLLRSDRRAGSKQSLPAVTIDSRLESADNERPFRLASVNRSILSSRRRSHEAKMRFYAR